MTCMTLKEVSDDELRRLELMAKDKGREFYAVQPDGSEKRIDFLRMVLDEHSRRRSE